MLEIPIGYAIRDAHLGLRPEKMIFLWTPGAVVRYLHPTHLLPRHTSFIMTVIIDYAPTSAPLSPPALLAFCFALCLVLPSPLPSFQPFLFLCSTVQCTSRPLRFLLFFPSILACVLPLSFIFLKTVHKRMRARIIFGWRIHRPNYAEKGSTNVRRPPFIDQSGRTLRFVANFQEMLCFVEDSKFRRISIVLVRP